MMSMMKRRWHFFLSEQWWYI